MAKEQIKNKKCDKCGDKDISWHCLNCDDYFCWNCGLMHEDDRHSDDEMEKIN